MYVKSVKMVGPISQDWVIQTFHTLARCFLFLLCPLPDDFTSLWEGAVTPEIFLGSPCLRWWPYLQ